MLPLLLLCLCAQLCNSCQQITVDICRSAGYNYTTMPNLVGHESQSDAEFTLQTFSPLVQFGCSARLGFFLCSVYVPMCNEKVSAPIGPCRGLCEAVRSRCYPVLQGFGFPWPTALDCAKFPLQNDHEHMCMEGPGEGLGVVMDGSLVPPLLSCTQYALPAMYFADLSGHCIQLCHSDVFFSRLDKDLAQVWIAVLSSICFVSSLIASLAFLGPQHSLILYPTRPLAFLVLCYFMVSMGWGLRAVLGREAVACYPGPIGHDPSPSLLLAQDGGGNAHCALVFFLTYYFGNAIAVWWTVLVICWFLCDGLHWTHDRILPLARLFHLSAWGLPACLTISVLVLRHVDANELTGMCSVGNHSPQSLLALVVVPKILCLSVGASVLLTGLAWGLRRSLVISLYLFPSAVTTASYLYQYWGHDLWILALSSSPTKPHPLFFISMLHCVITLSVGTAVSLWICLHQSVLCKPTLHTSSYKKPLTHTKVQENNYYKQTKIYRAQRLHKGNETFV